jgi:hypothetical protein
VLSGAITGVVVCAFEMIVGLLCGMIAAPTASRFLNVSSRAENGPVDLQLHQD